MSKELNAKVLALVQASGCNEYDQRSAMGIANTWIETQKLVSRDSSYMHLRDDLAESLIDVMRDNPRADCKAALQSARAVVNAPHRDETMNGINPGWLAARKAARGLNDDQS